MSARFSPSRDDYSQLFYAKSPHHSAMLNSPSQKPSLSYEQSIRKLSPNNSTIHHNPVGKHADITYAYYGDKGLPYSHAQGHSLSDGEQYKVFTARMKAMAEQTMKSWADVADIKFTLATNPEKADLKFGEHGNPSNEPNNVMAFGGGYTTWVKGLPEVWINEYDHIHGEGRVPGSFITQGYAHEIGHALGLAHPGHYNGGNPNYARNADYAEDSHGYTLMSYFSEQNTGQDFKGDSAEGPMLHDIAAIQHLYGANMHTRAGDTTYGFNSNSDRVDMSLHSPNDRIICSVWDAGGYNTFDFSGYKQNQKIDLHELAFSDVGGLKGNVSIAKGTHIQKVIGGQGDDVLIGNDDHNTIIGNGGNNLIYGGKGGDMLTGGSGHNTFLYGHMSDSTVDDPDTITNFKTGQDKIDLTGLYGGHNAAVPYASDGHTDRPGAVFVVSSYMNGGQKMTDLYITLDNHSHDHHDMKIKIVGDFSLHDVDTFPA